MGRPSTIRDQLIYVHSMPATDARGRGAAIRMDSLPGGVRTISALNLTVAVGTKVYDATATPPSRTLDGGDPTGVDLRRLVVACDTLTIRCLWWLPECDVEIRARLVIFESDGRIDTSPAPWNSPQAEAAAGSTPGRDGAAGRPAGSITLIAGDAIVPSEGGARLVARGGDGQKGGMGTPGVDGRDCPSGRLDHRGSFRHEAEYVDCGVKTKVRPLLDKHGDHTVTGIDVMWRVALSDNGPFISGTLERPTDGTDAVAPGRAGDGGDGGDVRTNVERLLSSVSNSAGRAAERQSDAIGGRAGLPEKSGFYRNTYYTHWNAVGTVNWIWGGSHENDNTGSCETTWNPHVTRAGATQKAAAGRDGGAGRTIRLDTPANAWLHPAAVNVAMDVARQAFLGEDRSEARRICEAYLPAFGAGMPMGGDCAWTVEDQSWFDSLRFELLSMSRRLDAGLDYFGNPAGHAPMLSLAGTYHRYRIELDTALRVLMFVSWLDAKQASDRALAGASRTAAGLLVKDSREAANEIAALEAQVADLRAKIVAAKGTQDDLLNRISGVRKSLTEKAGQDHARMAGIRISANIAAGLLQVVPFAQPVLGGVATSAAGAVDFLDQDFDDAKATVTRDVKATIGWYDAAAKETAALVKEAKQGAEEFAKAEDRKLTTEDLKKLNQTTKARWKVAASGLGSALGHFGTVDAVRRIPRAEIDAKVAKLAATDPAWTKLAEELKQATENRARLAAQADALLEKASARFAVLTGNSAAIARLDSDASSASARALGTSAEAVVADMGRRAVLTLTRALYDVVRAFESTRLTSVPVSWANEGFLAELNQAIGSPPMAEWRDSDVQARIETLRTAFFANLVALRREFAEGMRGASDEIQRDFSIDTGSVEALNEGDWIEFDTRELGFTSDDREHERLAGIELIGIAFDQGEPLPKSGDMIVTVQMDRVGIVRGGADLYGMQLPVPVSYEFTHHFGRGDVTRSAPSASGTDLLDIVLDDMDGRIRSRMALPPAWGTLRVRVAFAALRESAAPRLKALHFRVRVEGQTAPVDTSVVFVRSGDGITPIRMSGLEEGGMQEEDGFLSRHVVVPASGTRISLVSAERDRPVSEWSVTTAGRSRRVSGPELDLRVRGNTRVEARF